MRSVFSSAIALLLIFSISAEARMLHVGPGKQFKTIMAANKAASRGDMILVYPNKNNAPYEQTAIFVKKDKIIFKAKPAIGQKYIPISGKGFEYSGVGSIPRAIFQFNKGTDECTIDGFELFEAHNNSQNGAGVRINQANHITIRNCNIHNNDMGIMSNGDGSLDSAKNQLIERSWIHNNGSFEEPGFNHNFYLGGTSVTLRFCDIHNSLTGHNVKSRAHYTRIEYCYVHDSANREFDLVDGKETGFPESHAVLIGNIIKKDPACKGNRAVIHYGQDGGRQHDGTIYLIHNTIITPFISPVVHLSASKTKASFIGNIIWDNGSRQKNQKLVDPKNGSDIANVSGEFNWLSSGFSLPAGSKMEEKKNYLKNNTPPPFKDPKGGDFHLKGTFRSGLPARMIKIPSVPGSINRKPDPPFSFQYAHQAFFEKRPKENRLAVGAYPVKKRRR